MGRMEGLGEIHLKMTAKIAGVVTFLNVSFRPSHPSPPKQRGKP
jgi:hypothetical protein